MNKFTLFIYCLLILGMFFFAVIIVRYRKNKTGFWSAIANKMLMIAALTMLLLSVSLLISRKGNYVMNATRDGDSEYRDNRGLPLVFLKRALADGQCEVQSEQPTECVYSGNETFVGQDQRLFSYVYFAFDIAFWMVISTLLLWLGGSVRQRHALLKLK